MANVTEVELTYLAAQLPDVTGCKHVVLRDIYFPRTAVHPKLRIRQKGGTYEFTKKTQLNPDDAGTQQEENTTLTKDEFEALAHGDGREVIKTRYYLPYKGYTAEIDVFEGSLKGLVAIEFEFPNQAARAAFTKPAFCLADITQEAFIAGGMLAGKSYADIQPDLDRYKYQPLG